ncbi:MAG: CoA transferase [Chloroflexi bacterium]|nr:CoA transferase [Chloroflexota bacterium]
MPLDGVKVLDCTQQMAGPYCTLTLADLGADVVKVEKPQGGDDIRGAGPFIKGESAPFMTMNRNKRSAVLDLKHPQGQQAFLRLARSTDVLVENFRPGTMEDLGLDYETVRAIHPGIIYTSISGFGQTGPYRHRGGIDLVAQGMSGIMSLTGFPDMPPAKAGVPLTDIGAGALGAIGTLAAYIHRLRTGQGQHVDTSLLEAGIEFTFWETAILFASGRVPVPQGSAHRLSAPYQALKVQDGYIVVGAHNQRNWERLCRVLERGDLFQDPRFGTRPERLAHRHELEAELEKTLAAQSAAHWLGLLEKAGVPCGPINDMAQTYADPQVLARGMLQQVEHPVAGTVKQIGIPIKLSASPGRIRRPAPVLGQHTEEVLREAGFTAEEVERLREQGAIGPAAREAPHR